MKTLVYLAILFGFNYTTLTLASPPNGTDAPTFTPTSTAPTTSPTRLPTSAPELSTLAPTHAPVTSTPTASPTYAPTTSSPSASPTHRPTSQAPTVSPSLSPTVPPTLPPQCLLRDGIDREQCERMQKNCPASYKWRPTMGKMRKLVGNPPRCREVRTRTSGCRCADSCFYKIRKECDADVLCQWKYLETYQEFKQSKRRCKTRLGACYHRGTDQIGLPQDVCT